MKIFDKAQQKIDDAAMEKFGAKFPKWKKYEETKQMLEKYQRLTADYFKNKDYEGWEDDRNLYLGETQNLMNFILTDDKISNKEGAELNDFLSKKTSKLYEKLRIKQKEQLFATLTEKEVEAEKLINKRLFDDARDVYKKFLRDNKVAQLFPEFAFKVRETMLEVSIIKHKFNLFFDSGTVVHGLKDPNYVDGIDDDGNVELKSFTIVEAGTRESGYKDDNPIPAETLDEFGGRIPMAQIDIEDAPPVMKTDFLITLSKEKKKVHWKTLLKEIEKKKYIATKLNESTYTELIDKSISTYENAAVNKQYPNELVKEMLGVRIDKMLIQARKYYRNPHLEFLPEEDRPIMQAAIEENYTKYGLFFDENPDDATDLFYPTLLFKQAGHAQKIQILSGVLNNQINIFQRLKFEKKLENPKEDPIKKHYYRAEVALQNQDYVNAYAHFNKFLKYSDQAYSAIELKNKVEKRFDKFTKTPVKKLTKQEKTDKGYAELLNKTKNGLKTASIGILNLAENVINNIPMKFEKRKGFSAYKVIKKLRRLIEKGEAKNLHEAFSKLDAGKKDVDTNPGRRYNYNFDNLVRRIVTLSEIDDDKERNKFLENEAYELLIGRKETKKQVAHGDNFKTVYAANYWTHASEAFLSGIKQGEITKKLRQWHKNSGWMDQMLDDFSEKRGFTENYNSVNKLMMKKITQSLYSKGKAKEIREIIKSITDEKGRYIPGEMRLPKGDDSLKDALFIVASGGVAGFIGRGVTTFVASRLAGFAERSLVTNITAKLIAGTAGVLAEAPAFEAFNTILQTADRGGGIKEMYRNYTKKGVVHSLKFIGSMRIAGLLLNPLAKYTRMFKRVPPEQLSRMQKLTQNLFPNLIHMSASAGLMSYWSNTSFMHNLASMPLYHFGGAKFRKLFGKWETKAQLKSEIARMQLNTNPTIRAKAKLLSSMMGDKSFPLETIQIMSHLEPNQITDIKEVMKDPQFAAEALILKRSIEQYGKLKEEDKPLYDRLINRLKKSKIGKAIAEKLFNSVSQEDIATDREIALKMQKEVADRPVEGKVCKELYGMPVETVLPQFVDQMGRFDVSKSEIKMFVEDAVKAGIPKEQIQNMYVEKIGEILRDPSIVHIDNNAGFTELLNRFSKTAKILDIGEGEYLGSLKEAALNLYKQGNWRLADVVSKQFDVKELRILDRWLLKDYAEQGGLSLKVTTKLWEMHQLERRNIPDEILSDISKIFDGAKKTDVPENLGTIIVPDLQKGLENFKKYCKKKGIKVFADLEATNAIDFEINGAVYTLTGYKEGRGIYEGNIKDLEAMKEHLPPNPKILYLGSSGDQTVKKVFGKNCVNADLSGDFLDPKAGDIKIKDGKNLSDFKDGSFDMVVVYGLGYYMTPELNAAIHRIIRKGGYFYNGDKDNPAERVIRKAIYDSNPNQPAKYKPTENPNDLFNEPTKPPAYARPQGTLVAEVSQARLDDLATKLSKIGLEAEAKAIADPNASNMPGNRNDIRTLEQRHQEVDRLLTLDKQIKQEIEFLRGKITNDQITEFGDYKDTYIYPTLEQRFATLKRIANCVKEFSEKGIKVSPSEMLNFVALVNGDSKLGSDLHFYLLNKIKAELLKEPGNLQASNYHIDLILKKFGKLIKPGMRTRLLELVKSRIMKPEDLAVLEANKEKMTPEKFDAIMAGGQEFTAGGETIRIYKGGDLGEGGLGEVKTVWFIHKPSNKLQEGVVKTPKNGREIFFSYEADAAGALSQTLFKNQSNLANHIIKPVFISKDIIIYEKIADVKGKTADLQGSMETLSTQAWLTNFVGGVEGLVYLHRLGITHNDFKPANISIGKNGGILIDIGSFIFKKDVGGKITVQDLGSGKTAAFQSSGYQASVPSTPAFHDPRLMVHSIENGKPLNLGDKFAVGTSLLHMLSVKGYIADVQATGEHIPKDGAPDGVVRLIKLADQLKNCKNHPYEYIDNDPQKGKDPGYVDLKNAAKEIKQIASTLSPNEFAMMRH